MGKGMGSDFDERTARRLYEAGFSCRRVGDELGFSFSQVSKRLRAAGVEMRPEGRPLTTPGPAVDVDELVELREQGWTFPQIAEKFGLSKDAARDHYLRATGRPRRRSVVEQVF